MATKKKKSPAKKSGKNSDATLFAFLATFLSILGFIIALLAKREDKYVMFYAKQSLVIFLGWVIVGIIAGIPIIGFLAFLFVAVIWVFSWIYALSGKEKEVPVIGQFASKFNL